MLTYWAGEFDDFGKGWVNWDRDVSYLQSLGFSTDYREGLTGRGFESYLFNQTFDRNLHGIFFWGHGAYQKADAPWWWPFPDKKWMGLITDFSKFKEHQKTGTESYYVTDYIVRWRTNLSYRLALGLIYACGGKHSKPNNFSDISIHWGPPDVMVPIGTPSVSSIIKPGDQKTNRH